MLAVFISAIVVASDSQIAIPAVIIIIFHKRMHPNKHRYIHTYVQNQAGAAPMVWLQNREMSQAVFLPVIVSDLRISGASCCFRGFRV